MHLHTNELQELFIRDGKVSSQPSEKENLQGAGYFLIKCLPYNLRTHAWLLGTHIHSWVQGYRDGSVVGSTGCLPQDSKDSPLEWFWHLALKSGGSQPSVTPASKNPMHLACTFTCSHMQEPIHWHMQTLKNNNK